jgi:hypothetical protein
MVNNDERPINPKAAAAWDARKKMKATKQADELSKRQAIGEIAKASRIGGRESRSGMIESGISKPHTGGLVTGIINTGRRRKSSSW